MATVQEKCGAGQYIQNVLFSQFGAALIPLES